MTASHLQGPLQVGPQPQQTQVGGTVVAAGNMGDVVLAQSVALPRNATLTTTATFTLPANATIIGFDLYVDVAYDSATSATLTVGTTQTSTTIGAASATAFVTSVNAKTAGRTTATHTAAQSLAMSNVGRVVGTTAGVNVVATITSVGQPSVGTARLVCTYLQR